MSLKQRFFLFLFCFSFASCGEEEAKFTMSEDELVQLLYDIQAAEAALQTVHSNIKDSVITVYYDQIFEIHKIDQAILYENIKTLKTSPEKAHKIYKKVLDHHKNRVKDPKE